MFAINFNCFSDIFTKFFFPTNKCKTTGQSTKPSPERRFQKPGDSCLRTFGEVWLRTVPSAGPVRSPLSAQYPVSQSPSYLRGYWNLFYCLLPFPITNPSEPLITVGTQTRPSLLSHPLPIPRKGTSERQPKSMTVENTFNIPEVTRIIKSFNDPDFSRRLGASSTPIHSRS